MESARKPLELDGQRLHHWQWRRAALKRPRPDERTMNKSFALLLLPALLAGCATSITNLTPSRLPRDPSGYYRVEAAWYSRREVIRPDSFKPLVVVGFETYPMRRVPVVTDRWEAYIPVPADKEAVLYHYKFDFLDNAFGKPRPNSLMSRDYQLKIMDK